jgi:hypothetical protein
VAAARSQSQQRSSLHARGSGAPPQGNATRHPPPPPRGSTVAGQPAVAPVPPLAALLVNTYDDGSSRGPAGSELASGNDQLAARAPGADLCVRSLDDADPASLLRLW